MRVSGYISGAAVPRSRHFVLLHGYKSSLTFVDEALGERLIALRGADVEAEAFGEPERQRLQEAGVLTDLSADDERAIVVDLSSALRALNLRTAPTSFMIVPTVTCNLRCPYCFQSHEMHKGKGHFGGIISEDQLDIVFGAIDDLSAPGAVRAKALGLPMPPGEGARAGSTITLFGGEPLCRETLPVIPSIVRRARERGLLLSAITNGVELDMFEDWLGADAINHLQITLDGLAERHDRRRIGPRHKQTFETIVANVEKVLARGITVSMRINVDTDNLLNLADLNAYFHGRGWYRYSNFQPYAAAVDALAPGREKRRVTHADLYAETERLKEEADSRIASYESYAADIVSDIMMNPEGFALAKGSTCSAETGQLIFDPLGDIYSCWEDVGQSSLRIGTYGAGGIAFDTAAVEHWMHRFPGSIDQCARCPYALVHTSGCAAHARAAAGDLHASACEGFQQLFPASLGRAVRAFADKVDMLAAARQAGA